MMPNRHMYDMSREQMRAELRSPREPELMIAHRDRNDLDPSHLSDDELRKIVKPARWRTLLPRD